MQKNNLLNLYKVMADPIQLFLSWLCLQFIMLRMPNFDEMKNHGICSEILSSAIVLKYAENCS